MKNTIKLICPECNEVLSIKFPEIRNGSKRVGHVCKNKDCKKYNLTLKGKINKLK